VPRGLHPGPPERALEQARMVTSAPNSEPGPQVWRACRSGEEPAWAMAWAKEAPTHAPPAAFQFFAAKSEQRAELPLAVAGPPAREAAEWDGR